MALTDYERYQLEWMIDHGHSLGELMNSISMLQKDYEVAPDHNKTVDELFDIWGRDSGFGGEIFASEAEWRDAEGKENRSDSVRDWYMEAYPDDGLGASIDPQMTFDRALDALGVGDSLVRERIFQELSERTGITYDDIYDAWMDEKPVKASPSYGITKDMVREGIEHGVIRFEANPDPTDPWKTMCCVGEDGGLFYFVDTTDIPVSEYIRMNQNNLDMVVDDVWEALNGDIKRDFADDYERYAAILSEPHQGGTSSLSLPEESRMQAVGVGYAFNLLPPETVAGIGLKDSGTVVTVDGQDYPLMKGATYEDSCRVDGLLDSYGEKRVSDYIKEPVTLKGEVAQARAASSAISQENADGRLDKNLDERISR